MTTSSETIADLGEFGAIRNITSNLTMPTSVSVGPGDDAAVFLVNGSAVTSVDMLVEGVHFRHDWSGGADVGRRAVGVNVADIEAMGARARTMVVGLSLPASTSVSWLKEFATGMRDEAERAGIGIVGGDLVSGERITVSVTVIGETAGTSPVLRSGAKPGHVIAFAGRLGWASAGLAALQRGFRSPRAAVDAHRYPVVPYGAGRVAAKAGATAMIDISDGLVADLGHIAAASGVSIDIFSATLPIDEPVRIVATALNVDPLSFVLGGGEDHALVAAFDASDVPDEWTVIGRVCEPDAYETAVVVDGIAYEGEPGWRHF